MPLNDLTIFFIDMTHFTEFVWKYTFIGTYNFTILFKKYQFNFFMMEFTEFRKNVVIILNEINKDRRSRYLKKLVQKVPKTFFIRVVYHFFIYKCTLYRVFLK